MGGFGILKGIGAGLASAAGNDTMLKDMELEKRRKMAASDDFAMGQVKLLTDAITNLQNNPTLSPEEKAAKIGAARSEMLKYYTPMIGKKRAAEFQKQFGLSTTPAMSGMTPAEAPTSVSPEAMGGQPQQAPFSEEEIASSGGAVGKPSPEAIQVPSEMAEINLGQPQPLELPGKQPQQVSYTPPSGDEILAESIGHQFVPVTLSNGTTMMLPSAQAARLLATQESNAGKMGTTQVSIKSREDIARENRESRESIADANRQSREKVAASRPARTNRDDQIIGIYQREYESQDPNITPDQAYQKGFNRWVQETKVYPRVKGYQALSASRYIPVVDPNNPGSVIPMAAGNAAKQGVSLPASISFQTDKALTRAFTSGKPAENLMYFNTAIKHLDQLKEVASALNNGDVPALNKLAQAWSQQTGEPAPVNFDDVKQAVINEIAKTFAGKGATKQEIDALTANLNRSQSPQQLMGGIDQFTKLMVSKRDALKQQYAAGKQGQPNFGDNASPADLKQKATQLTSGTVRYQDGKDTYNIPASDVPEFLKDHPNAKPVTKGQ